MIHRLLVSAMYPLHDTEALKLLSSKWYFSKDQPVGEFAACTGLVAHRAPPLCLRARAKGDRPGIVSYPLG